MYTEERMKRLEQAVYTVLENRVGKLEGSMVDSNQSFSSKHSYREAWKALEAVIKDTIRIAPSLKIAMITDDKLVDASVNTYGYVLKAMQELEPKP